jgi:hypothetical protein
MLERDIYQGMIYFHNPTIRLSRSRTIPLDQGDRFSYRTGDRKSFVFDCCINGNDVRLNDLVSNEWDFVPVSSKFQVRLSENGAPYNHPQVQLCIDQLEEDPLAIMIVFHEIGHAELYDFLWIATNRNHNVRHFGFPISRPDEYPYDGTYNAQLIALHQAMSQNNGDDQFRLLCERYAWAYALKASKNLGLLERFGVKTVRDYYRNYLNTYS